MKLPKKATVREAVMLASTMRTMSCMSDLRIDASAVESIDSSILQLLWALRRAVPSSTILSPSDAFLDAAERCGAEHLLHDEPLEAA